MHWLISLLVTSSFFWMQFFVFFGGEFFIFLVRPATVDRPLFVFKVPSSRDCERLGLLTIKWPESNRSALSVNSDSHAWAIVRLGKKFHRHGSLAGPEAAGGISREIRNKKENWISLLHWPPPQRTKSLQPPEHIHLWLVNQNKMFCFFFFF